MDFTIASASEADASFRQFFLSNFPTGTFEHVYTTVEDQLQDRGCLVHPTCAQCAPCQEVDLMMTGSPCDPFSTARTKRFHADSVRSHIDYKTTFKSVVAMYAKYEPVVGIVEQVQGFQRPIETGSDVTPKQLYPNCRW